MGTNLMYPEPENKGWSEEAVIKLALVCALALIVAMFVATAWR